MKKLLKIGSVVLVSMFITLNLLVINNSDKKMNDSSMNTAYAQSESGGWYEWSVDYLCHVRIGHCDFAQAQTICAIVPFLWHCTPTPCYVSVSQKDIDECMN